MPDNAAGCCPQQTTTSERKFMLRKQYNTSTQSDQLRNQTYQHQLPQEAATS
jgi:hypothetical protein